MVVETSVYGLRWVAFTEPMQGDRVTARVVEQANALAEHVRAARRLQLDPHRLGRVTVDSPFPSEGRVRCRSSRPLYRRSNRR